MSTCPQTPWCFYSSLSSLLVHPLFTATRWPWLRLVYAWCFVPHLRPAVRPRVRFRARSGEVGIVVRPARQRSQLHSSPMITQPAHPRPAYPAHHALCRCASLRSKRSPSPVSAPTRCSSKVGRTHLVPTSLTCAVSICGLCGTDVSVSYTGPSRRADTPGPHPRGECGFACDTAW
jgi:hypothetical protein